MRVSTIVAMERNLYIRNLQPHYPTRACLNTTGPRGPSDLIAMATMAQSQQGPTRISRLNAIPNARL